MVVTIFRSRLDEEYLEEYQSIAPDIFKLAQSMPGFISFKSFSSTDGERVSIIEFETLEYLQAWRDHPEHQKAQELGRERFYTEYKIQVCEPLYQREVKSEPEGA